MAYAAGTADAIGEAYAAWRLTRTELKQVKRKEVRLLSMAANWR